MLSIIILSALIKLNLAIEKPMVPAAIYAAAAFLFGLVLGHGFLSVAVSAPINYGLGFLFFWLLKKTEGETSFWFVVVGGIALFLALSFGIRSIQR